MQTLAASSFCKNCWANSRVVEAETIGHHFADARFDGIFLNKIRCVLIQISLKFVPKGLVDSIHH